MDSAPNAPQLPYLSLPLSSSFLYFSLLGFLLCPLRDFDIWCRIYFRNLKISLPIALSLLLSFCHFPENIPAFYGGPFSFLISTMVTICQKCGDRGFSVALIYCDRCSVYAQHRNDLFAVCWFAFMAMCVRSRVRLDTIV